MSLNNFNDLKDAIVELQNELGQNPGGVYSNLRARIDIVEARVNNPNDPSPNVENPFIIGNTGIIIKAGAGLPVANDPDGSLYLRSDGYAVQGLYARRNGAWLQVNTDPWIAGGDLSGTYQSQTVVALRNWALAPQPIAPTDGYVLTWDNALSAWKPSPATGGGGGSFTAGGDLTGNSISQTVAKINGRAVASTLPSDGYVLTWDNAGSTWKPASKLVTRNYEMILGYQSNIGVVSSSTFFAGHATVTNIPTSYTYSFKVIAKKTNTNNGSVILYNLTDASIITTITVTSNDYQEYTSSITLTGSTPKLYEVQMLCTGTPGVSDGIICTSAKIVETPI